MFGMELVICTPFFSTCRSKSTKHRGAEALGGSAGGRGTAGHGSIAPARLQPAEAAELAEVAELSSQESGTQARTVF